MARPSARSWLPWLLGALALGAALAYLFSSVRVVITGMGTVEPVFEELSVPTNKWACVVTRVFVSPGQQIERATPLFEWITDGEWVVASTGVSAMIKPGAAPPALPEARLLYQRSFDRAQALRRWSTLVASAERPREWEGRLAQRLSIRVERADDLAMAAVIEAERERRGSDGDLVYRERTARKGQVFMEPVGLTFESDVAGVIYSLWIRPRLPYLTVLPVGEILRPDTPIEVLGLVPSPPAALRDLDGWRADLLAPRDGSATNLVAKAIELGRVPLEAPDAKLLFPDLAGTHRSVFARFLLDDASARERLGAPVLITLTSPARSRLSLWLGSR